MYQKYRAETFVKQGEIFDLENFNAERERLTSLRSEEHTSELQSLTNLVCRLLLEKKKKKQRKNTRTNKMPTLDLRSKNKG